MGRGTCRTSSTWTTSPSRANESSPGTRQQCARRGTELVVELGSNRTAMHRCRPRRAGPAPDGRAAPCWKLVLESKIPMNIGKPCWQRALRALQYVNPLAAMLDRHTPRPCAQRVLGITDTLHSAMNACLIAPDINEQCRRQATLHVGLRVGPWSPLRQSSSASLHNRLSGHESLAAVGS